ncbi:hypothetical protein HW555_005619 [Spodoptera exigua]|uniref:Uncharacterized protein n=1 Tax=Spodoptera exigua TaxID=7107 RepID=A0A835L783_SPOEX|nr:hypothetical protein HW555_005619 [Spodoptera exigua]
MTQYKGLLSGHDNSINNHNCLCLSGASVSRRPPWSPRAPLLYWMRSIGEHPACSYGNQNKKPWKNL